MYVIDASVWVSAYLTSDINHQPAIAWLEQQMANNVRLWAPVTALSEVAGAVSRRGGDSALGVRIASAIEAIPQLNLAPVTLGFTRSSVSVAARLRLRGADANYVALAEASGFPLVTFDREQATRSAPVVAVVTPAALR